jgi:hypothetical protein
LCLDEGFIEEINADSTTIPYPELYTYIAKLILAGIDI